MPFEHSLGLRVRGRHKDGVTVELPLRDDLLNSTGVLHGGITASIADEAAWHAIIHNAKREVPMTTTELKVNYLRPIKGKKVIARAVVLRAGKTLCVTRVDIKDSENRLSAVAVVTYILL